MQPTPQVPRGLLVASVHEAVQKLLTTHEPEFIRIGFTLFLALATILVTWQGVRMMFTLERGPGDHIFRFAQQLLFISFAYAMIAYYESPIPGLGVSFSNLITDQAHYIANILDATAIERVFDHLDTLQRRLVIPDPWALLATLLYWVILVLLTLAKLLSFAIVAFGMIATAVCGLLGPLFVPFLIVPKLDFLFWNWFKSILQYSFIQVVAYAFLMIFENFFFRYLTTLPAGLTEAQYVTYGLQVLVVTGTFCVGILLVPSLTSSLFSGRGGESILPVRML